MKTALLDVNVLTALLWPAHEHHAAAHAWASSRTHTRWATCPLTQLGFVRLVTNPTFSRDALTAGDAVALLSRNVTQPNHEFWSETLPIGIAIRGMAPRIQGYRQLTDAYLLAVAKHHKGVLATFDRGMRSLAGEAFDAVLEILPTR